MFEYHLHVSSVGVSICDRVAISLCRCVTECKKRLTSEIVQFNRRTFCSKAIDSSRSSIPVVTLPCMVSLSTSPCHSYDGHPSG